MTRISNRAAEIVEIFSDNALNEHDSLLEAVNAVMDGLCDGEALANSGICDADQSAVEEAYGDLEELRDRLERTIYIQSADGIEAITLNQVYSRFASEVNTPCGIQKEYFYDHEESALMKWQFGKKRIVREEVGFIEAVGQLLGWALYDLNNDPDVSWAWNREELEEE